MTESPKIGEHILRCKHTYTPAHVSSDPTHFLKIPKSEGIPFEWICMCEPCYEVFGVEYLQFRETIWDGKLIIHYVGNLEDKKKKTRIQ